MSATLVAVVIMPSPLVSLQSATLAATTVERPVPRALMMTNRPSIDTAVRDTLSIPPFGPVM